LPYVDCPRLKPIAYQKIFARPGKKAWEGPPSYRRDVNSSARAA
jgi:hypothetical protein